MKDTLGLNNPYRYRGYRYDTETGLYYLQSRYYNPEWGRFINADAIVTGNEFAYCGNNPVNYVNPTGFMNECYDGGGGDYERTGNAGSGKVDDPSITGSLIKGATGYDSYVSYATGAAEKTIAVVANNIYNTVVSNSSSRVEAYGKLLDVANKADGVRSLSGPIKAIGKWGGIAYGASYAKERWIDKK